MLNPWRLGHDMDSMWFSRDTQSAAKTSPDADRLTSLELLVAKFSSLMLWLAMWGMTGLARAAEIQDTPPTEPNYFGIIIFLVLMVGGGVWFMWRVMRNKGDGK
jgi:hypothetical protein